MQPLSLLSDHWLPVRRRSGVRTWIAPHQLVDGIETDPVVRPDWGRADFDAATLEFLIGLLATACPPDGIDDWAARDAVPPSSEALAAAFLPFAPAFVLDGEGARFMQEFGGLAGETVPVSGLFIEAPGANTEEKNADLFQKRGRMPVLGLPAAAMALFTLQTYAPSGGRGNRTSLRGGGPLTTLAMPPDSETLWHWLWLNVPEPAAPLPNDLARIFPWLAQTRTSEGKDAPLGDDDIDPRGVFWGMPRRISLEIEGGTTDTICSLTGEPAPALVASFRTRPWGMNYGALLHPLSPMYRQKVGSEWLFLHPQPGGLSYRHWVDMATDGAPDTALRRAAPAVQTARARLGEFGRERGRLWSAGYDTDNMKARGFVEATFPLFARDVVDIPARSLVLAAQEAASLAAGAIKDALGIDASDASRIAALREDVFARTQTSFFEALDRLDTGLTGGEALSEVLPASSRVFLEEALRPIALELFDRHSPLLRPDAREAERIVKARLYLVRALRGYGKRGKTLFDALSLPLPDPGEGKSKKSRKEEAAA